MCGHDAVIPLCNKVIDSALFYILDLQHAQGLALGLDLTGLVSVQVHGKPIGIESKLPAHLKESNATLYSSMSHRMSLRASHQEGPGLVQ